MGGGKSKKEWTEEEILSGKKYEGDHKQATKKLGAGQKQHEAAIKLQKNVRIYLQSTRRMLGGHHVFTKAFMEYGPREGPEGFLVGYGYDPARDSLVKKRMGSKEFLAFVLECELYGGGQMGTKDVAEKIFTEQYTLQNKKQEKQLRDREIREGIRRGSLKFEPRKEVDSPTSHPSEDPLVFACPCVASASPFPAFSLARFFSSLDSSAAKEEREAERVNLD